MPFEIVLRVNAIRSAALGIAFAAIAPQFDALARSNWAIDPARAHIGFSIDAVGLPRTEFERFDGRLDLDRPRRAI